MELAKLTTRPNRLGLKLSSLPWLFIGATLVLALPFFLVGNQANQNLFLSNQHANLVEKALLALDRGRVEYIGFVYPPLPFLMILPFPRPLSVVAVSSLIAGATVWILWLRVSSLSFPLIVKVLLLLLSLSVPSIIFLATQSAAEMLLLLLLVITWNNFIAFTHQAQTGAGFKAGLALGIAYLVNYYAALYALFYALSVPLFLREKRRGAAVASAIVLIFPVFTAFLAWTYINWVFVGDPFYYLKSPISSPFIFLQPDSNTGAVLDGAAALRSIIRDLLSVPLYLVVAVLIAWQQPGRLLMFVAPFIMVYLARASNIVYSEYLAISTFTLIALIGIPRRTPRQLWPVLVGAVLLQVWIGYSVPPQDELAKWWEVVTTNRSQNQDKEEQEIAQYLVKLSPHSILVNDVEGYRIVARAETAQPFLLPPDSLYLMARSQPALFVQYVLVPSSVLKYPITTRGADSGIPQTGFHLQMSWPNWLLYERNTGSVRFGSP